MTSIAEVRQSLADAITQGTGVVCFAYASDTVHTPGAMVLRKAMDPRMVFGGASNVYEFAVVAYAGRAEEVAAQTLIDEWCEPGSGFKQAIEDGALWSATIDYAAVTQIGETQAVDIGGGSYLAVEFTVEVVW